MALRRVTSPSERVDVDAKRKGVAWRFTLVSFVHSLY